MKDAGWQIWATSGDRVRQFTVAEVDESAAIEVLKSFAPDAVVVSRHKVDEGVRRFLKLEPGRVMEWVAADPRDKLTPGGVPISEPMK